MPLAKNVRFCEATKTQIDIFYDVTGNPQDTPILLVSGLQANLKAYNDKFVETLVSKRFYVIRMDNRDVGLSTNGVDNKWSTPYAFNLLTPTWLSPAPTYTIEDMAQDCWGLLDFVLEKGKNNNDNDNNNSNDSQEGTSTGAEPIKKEERRKVVVAGTSLGSLIAVSVACQQPDRIAGLITLLGGPKVPGLPDPPYWVQKEFLLGSGVGKTIEEDAQLLADWMMKVFMPPPKNENEEKEHRSYLYEHLLATKKHSTKFEPVNQLYAGVHVDMKAREKMLTAALHPSKRTYPAITFHGKFDLVFSLEHGLKFHELFTGGKNLREDQKPAAADVASRSYELVVLPDCGHVLLPKHFDLVATKIASMMLKK